MFFTIMFSLALDIFRKLLYFSLAQGFITLIKSSKEFMLSLFYIKVNSLRLNLNPNIFSTFYSGKNYAEEYLFVR